MAGASAAGRAVSTVLFMSQRFMSQRLLQWITLAAILAGLLAFVSAAPTADLFGRIHFDDGVYFDSAKALSQEGRYVVASMPGSPPQTKYPVLYPWILSWVWTVHPAFPANVPRQRQRGTRYARCPTWPACRPAEP